MLFGVGLAGAASMLGRFRLVSGRSVRMVGSLFVVAGRVLLGGFGVVSSGLRVMVSGLLVVVGGFGGHGWEWMV